MKYQNLRLVEVIVNYGKIKEKNLERRVCYSL